jgi:UDP-glucuronate 4-epimerase
MNITGLRLFTVYGPWGRPDMAVYKFTRAMLSGLPIDVFNHGRMRRDFTYIDDIITGIIQAGRQEIKRYNGDRHTVQCRLYNLGNNQPVELTELITTLEEFLGVKAILRFQEQQPGEVLTTYADITASTRDLDFQPRTSLREGVERFVAWYRDYHREPSENINDQRHIT